MHLWHEGDSVELGMGRLPQGGAAATNLPSRWHHSSRHVVIRPLPIVARSQSKLAGPLSRPKGHHRKTSAGGMERGKRSYVMYSLHTRELRGT